MKKSLSLLVAIAMVFSMFATVASADTQSNYDILFEAGIFKGYPDGSAGLDKEMTRAEYAAVIARVTGVSSDDVADFIDIPADHWAGKDINAVVEAGYLQGVGGGKFDPAGKVTLEQMIAIAVRLLGLEVDEEATVDGKVSAWAQAEVAAALNAGIIQPLSDYTANATRGDLVDITIIAYEYFSVAVAGYEVVDLNKVVVSFTDGGEVEVELEEALKPGKNTITVTYNDREYEVTVEVEAAAATAKAVGAKKIEVTFNKPIDESKVEFAVKNGIADRVVDKFTVSDDKKVAVLELTTKLQAGETTVTIKGIEADDIEAKFTAEDERVTQVKFKSDKLALLPGANNQPDYNKAKVGYQILNQYGEEVTNAGTPTFQVSKATASISPSNGVLTVDVTGFTPFYIGETVVVSGYLMTSTYTVPFNETLTVGQPATLDSVTIKGLYHPENKELNTASTFSDFVLLIEAKDQYGNTLSASDVNNGAIITVTNPGIFTVGAAQDNQGENKDQVGIPLAAPSYTGFDGTNQVRIMTLFGGKTFTYDVEVKKASTVQKITLSAPSQIVAANDGTVKIPFYAEDQFGNEIKKYSDLAGKLTLYPSSLQLKQDYVTKEAYLELTLPTPQANQQVAIPYPIMASVNATGNSSQITISIEKPAYAESVVGLASDVAATLAQGATTEIKSEHVKIKDNYGRDMKADDLLADGYTIDIVAADGAFDTVTLSPAATLTDTNKSITVTAAAKGSERIKVQLKNASNEVVHSYESFIFSVVDNSGIVEYSVEDLPKMSDKPGHEVDLKVVGKRSNGTTVALPASAYTVTTTVTGLSFNAGKLDATNVSGFNNDGEVNGKVIVTIIATGDRFEKDVVVSNEALRATTIELKDESGLKAENNVVKGPADQISIATVFTTLKVKDQFGVEMTPADTDFTATVSNPDDVNKTTVFTVNNNGQDVANVTVSGVDQGDSFTVVFTSKQTGVSISVRVVAE